MTVCLMLIVVGGSPEWRGFHGLERQGHAPDAAPPRAWSPEQNILWKTPIPGRGHSSPVVAGDAVYVTTVYESANRAALRSLARYGLLALALLLAAGGIARLVRMAAGRRHGVRSLLHGVLIFAFTLDLAVVVGMVLFGDRPVDLTATPLRAWWSSTFFLCACIGLAALAVPARSLAWLGLSAVAFLTAIPVLVARPPATVLFRLTDRAAIISTAMAVMPAALGAFVLVVHGIERARARRRDGAREERRSLRAAIAVVALAAGPASLIALAGFGAVAYLSSGMSFDLTAWEPSLGWSWLALAAVTCAASLGISLHRFARAGGDTRGGGAISFTTTALLTGALFFVNATVVAEGGAYVRALLRLDAERGTVRWITEAFVKPRDVASAINSAATPTPFVEGSNVFAYFGSAGLVAADASGAMRWKAEDLPFVSVFGAASSPIPAGGSIVIASDSEPPSEGMPAAGSYVAALDAATGALAWRRERPWYSKAFAGFSTPIARTIAGRSVIIVQGWDDLVAYDAATSAPVWRYPRTFQGRHLVAGAVTDGERLFVVDGRTVAALVLAKLADGRDAPAWTQDVLGEKSSTPVVVDGLLYVVTEEGAAWCLDAASGSVQWKARLKGRYFASIIAAGDAVFFTSENGHVTVVAAGRELAVLAENALDEKIYATPVPWGTRLLVRTVGHVYCIGSR